MPPGISDFVQRWLAGARAVWPLITLIIALAFLLGYQTSLRTQQPLTPPFAFTNGTSTIQARGTWRTSAAAAPNATSIFCWLPINSCQVTVASLLPDGSRARLQLTDRDLDITQLSDVSLTATASSTDSCHVETLHIDRNAHTATLSVGPSAKATTCAGITTQTATLGG